MDAIVDLFVNLDEHLIQLVADYGSWVYALLFAVIFAETGLVVTPILPGDSLLFATGAIAATGALDIRIVILLLIIAAVLGDAVNYAIGRRVGPMIFSATDMSSRWHRLLNRRHLEQAHEFFERYGGKAIVLGRFVPIVRTFVPFVAGAGTMTYGKFAFYNIFGGILWVGVCTIAGYAFGNIPVVKDNFSLVALGIVIVSVLPALYEIMRGRRGPTPVS